MSYLVLYDSCADLTAELKNEKEVIKIPLKINIGEKIYIDDDNLDVASFIKDMNSTKELPKSACPSPEDYMKYFDEADEVYIVTLSDKLSGSYNSAKLAKDLYIEENNQKKIHIFNSKAASVGETVLVGKIVELKNMGLGFDEIVDRVEEFNKKKQIKFVLESLENLKKSGRLTGVKALIADALNIKPILKGNKEGEIEKIGQARGINKACNLLAEMVISDANDVDERELVIAHCENEERAIKIRDIIKEKLKFKKISIVKTGGISSMYAQVGGIIISY